MAEVLQDRRIILTSASDTVEKRFLPKAVTVIASADTWALKINDINGVTAIQAESDVANERSKHFPVGGEMNGLSIETWTDISSVIIYVDRFLTT